MATSDLPELPQASDIITITWHATHLKEKVKVASINKQSINIEYQDNNGGKEDHLIENGQLPFGV